MKRITLTLSFLCFLLNTYPVFSQAGIKFAELARRLEPYFDKALILDIQRQLPQGSDYSIWGWDVGDFSGDGNIDVAMSIKLATERKRIAQVYLFVDIDGYLTKAGQFSYSFVDLPLEIGVVIRDNACYITQKNKQYDWLIRGYTFDNGSLILLDEFTTSRIDNLTYETYRNYITLRNTQKYIVTGSGKVEHLSDYLVIPSYPRNRLIYKGYNPEPMIGKIDYVYKGAYHWKGEDDASFTVRSAYDDDYLYMTVNVTDDVVVAQNCDTCPCDHVELWLDVNPPESDRSRYVKSTGSKLEIRNNADTGIFRFSIFPGNFLDKKAFMRISATDELETYQKVASRTIKAVSNLTENGYVVKFKIPFQLLGYSGNPVEDNSLLEIGCTIAVYDIDNEFRPEEATWIASSAFSPLNPSTYGLLVLIPKEQWYGDTKNIYQDDILNYLLEYGF